MKKTHKIILGSVGACAMVAAVLSLTLVDCEGKDDDFNATPDSAPVVTKPVPEPEPAYTVCPAGEVKVATPNGALIWAGSNLSGYQTFADNSYDFGCLFQWGSKTAIPGNPTDGNSNTVTMYHDGAGNSDGTWFTANNPCPTGWRMPTADEWAWLINLSSWDTSNSTSGVADGTYTTISWRQGIGVDFGAKIVSKSTGEVLWLSNTGIRDPGGKSGSVGHNGCYWTDNLFSNVDYARYIDFNVGNHAGYTHRIGKPYALAVRCVR